MTYVDLYLRAGNAGALASACPFLRGEGEDGKTHWITGTVDFALSVIGPVVAEPGTYDDEGAELTAPVMDNRFHANLRCTPEIAELVPDSVRVSPSSPSRVWA